MKKSNYQTFASLIGINPEPAKGNTFAEMMANIDARRPTAGVEGWNHRTRAGGYREASDTIDTKGNRR